LLWASTGTKDPLYSDVKYVEALIAPDTVNTLPLDTLEAYRGHGQPELRIDAAIEQAPAAAGWTPAPAAVDGVRVVFEDGEVVVVTKPAGVPSVPLRPEETGTVANALVAHDGALAALGRTPRDAGLVSRLDAGTSGLLLAGRTPGAFAALLRSTAQGEVRKGYMALVEGVRRGPWPAVVRRPLQAGGPRRAAVVAGAESTGSRVPETRILRTRAGAGATLVVAEIVRGERHQIRAHLAAIGHPVWGDVARGGRPLGDAARGDPLLALHAAWVEFPHPRTGHRLRLEAPPVEPLASALREARLPVRRREEP